MPDEAIALREVVDRAGRDAMDVDFLNDGVSTGTPIGWCRVYPVGSAGGPLDKSDIVQRLSCLSVCVSRLARKPTSEVLQLKVAPRTHALVTSVRRRTATWG
jgi:hypothetical protein